MNRRRWISSALLSSTIAVAGCYGRPSFRANAAAASSTSPAKPIAGGTVTLLIEDDVIDLDPLVSRSRVDRNVHYQIYDSLVAIDSRGRIIPWLAEKWTIAGDGRSITLDLRPGVKFHDGSPFDANAVKWNIDRYRWTKGSARSGELAAIASVDAIGPSTARINLKTPYSPLLATLVDRAGMMVSPKAAAAGGREFTRHAFKAGTGPFVLTEAVKDDHITLERNPDWWGTDKDGTRLPYLEKIIVKPIADSSVRLSSLKGGDAQITTRVADKDVAGVKADGTLTYQQKPSYSFQSLIPNEKPGYVFEDHRLVKAVSMAINRQEILERVFFDVGSVGYGAIAPPHFAYDPNFKPFAKPDPDGARRLVDAVGNGTLSFELLVPADDQVAATLTELIQSQLANAGIQANLVQRDFAEILKRQDEHSFKGMTIDSWGGRIDPDANTYDSVCTGQRFNDSSYSNHDVDRLLNDQRRTIDVNQRKADLRKAEQTYAVDDPAQIWYRFGVSQLLTVKKLQGLEPYPDQIVRFQYAWLQN